ncbi:MAG: hypothetical protein AAGK00_20590 [Pseudomonadota bacterium]
MTLMDWITRQPVRVGLGLTGSGLRGLDIEASAQGVELAEGVSLPLVTNSLSGLMRPTDKTKLDGLLNTTVQLDPANFISRAQVTATEITDPNILYLRTAGFVSAGDGGGGLYARVPVEPAHEGKVQTANGIWFELVDMAPNAAQFGATLSSESVNAALLYGLGTAHLPAANITLDDQIQFRAGDVLSGQGWRATILANPNVTPAFDLPPLPVGGKSFGITVRDLALRPGTFSDANGDTIRAIEQGYPSFENVEFWGGRHAVYHGEGVVGQRTWAASYARSPIGEDLANPNLLNGNTAFLHVGLVRDILGVGIRNQGPFRHMVNMGGIWQNINKLIEQTDDDAIQSFVSFGDWFEGCHPDRVSFSPTGFSADLTKSGEIVTERMNAPLVLAPYFSGDHNWKGSYYPRIREAHVTPEGGEGIFFVEETDTDSQFDLDLSANNWGTLGVYGMRGNLPKHGDWATPDEKHYRQGVFQSLGAANSAGIWDGASAGCANLLDTPPTQTGFVAGQVYWPAAFQASIGGTFAMTPGQADPYGGTSAVRFENGTAGTFNIPAFADGGQWLTAVAVVRGTAPDADVVMRILGVGGTQLQKTVVRRLPDTAWRLLHLSVYLLDNPGGNIRFQIGTEGSTADIARAAVYQGADLHPPLNYGQAVDQPFRFVHGAVEILGDAVPNAGTWFPRDRVRQSVPAVGQPKGWICTEGGTFGTADPVFVSEGAL